MPQGNGPGPEQPLQGVVSYLLGGLLDNLSGKYSECGKTLNCMTFPLWGGPAGGVSAVARGGAALENISMEEALRIQNAANRAGTEISLVGSRAAGTANAASDWDYVIDGSARLRNSLSGSLPGARSVAEGLPQNLDIFRGPLDLSLPSITFLPLKP